MGADPIRPILKRVEDDVGFHLWVHIGRPKSDEDIPTDVQDSPHNVQDNVSARDRWLEQERIYYKMRWI